MEIWGVLRSRIKDKCIKNCMLIQYIDSKHCSGKIIYTSLSAQCIQILGKVISPCDLGLPSSTKTFILPLRNYSVPLNVTKTKNLMFCST